MLAGQEGRKELPSLNHLWHFGLFPLCDFWCFFPTCGSFLEVYNEVSVIHSLSLSVCLSGRSTRLPSCHCIWNTPFSFYRWVFSSTSIRTYHMIIVAALAPSDWTIWCLFTVYQGRTKKNDFLQINYQDRSPVDQEKSSRDLYTVIQECYHYCMFAELRNSLALVGICFFWVRFNRSVVAGCN